MTFSGALLVKTTIREIVRREKVSKERVLKDLSPDERSAFEKLLPRAKH